MNSQSFRRFCAPIVYPAQHQPNNHSNQHHINTNTHARENTENPHANKRTYRTSRKEHKHLTTSSIANIIKEKPWRISLTNIAQRRAKQKRSRLFQYNTTTARKSAIADETGEKTLTIISINPDNLINMNRQNELICELQRRKVHNDAIQETHIPHGLDIARNGYRIITSAALPGRAKPEQYGMYQGGVAILGHANMQQIYQIIRANRRILKNSTQIGESIHPHNDHNVLCTTQGLQTRHPRHAMAGT